ncbi:MAG: relaxase domain-containing protein [Pegethrix bostrychoides GSE-TBD4-15B]|jgi:conjugative relaxase-like TrwC/TraI family protein|uniref:Relaxase domain-containing protein n=1 Tax=Pegethrix bostrychoides GSE-TBD4-15B TaxID=2839662 RepID=A0A951PBS6_9CYAN|nr:relaxase domain-containing protein [Pegethrix bostrychoides GSE-TBD4-15B]
MSNLSANQAENYYDQDDYYVSDTAKEQSKTQSSTAQWQGKGAAALGLSGAVEQVIFQKLLYGRSPQGHSLHAKRIDPANHRAATDYTFSAPKSVSIAALIQQDWRVVEAHQQAVETALSVLEARFAQTRISTPQGRQRVTTGNIIAALFQHQTSREQDPQLHSHCVVVNATQLADGSWRSFSNEAVVRHQKLLGQIYQNELAYRLRQLGYQITPRSNGQFELAGYDPDLLKAFSTRTGQIQDYLNNWQQQLAAEARLPLEAHQKKQATLKTRRVKQIVSSELLLKTWQQQIETQGLQVPALPTLTQDVTELNSVNQQAAIEAAIESASERETVFRRSQVERFLLEHHLGQFPFSELQQAITTHPELVLVDAIQEKYTTQTAIQRELDTIRLMQQGKGTMSAIVAPEEVAQLLDLVWLTAGQREAVTLAAITTDQYIAWQGVAGAGKTSSLRLYKEIAEARGYRLRGFAPSAQAAAELAQGASIPSDTIASLLCSPFPTHQPQLPGNEIWVVDEASLLSAKVAYDLLRRAKAQQGRVLLVGDTRQLSAVEAGSPFRSLQAGGIATVRLNQSLRQQSQELRSAVALVAQDRVVEGVRTLEQAGCIHEIADPKRQLEQLVDDYLELSAQERDQTLLLAGTNQQRLDLTQHLRERLQQEGGLGNDAFTLLGLRQKNLTTVQSCYATSYKSGNVLIPHQDYRKQGLYKHQHYTVLAKDQASNQLTLQSSDGKILQINPAHCPKKTLYQMQSLPVAAGDHLRWIKNDRRADIRNGQAFVVDSVTPDGMAQVTDRDGKTKQLNLNGRQHLDYAWVSTVHSSQGRTANRVLTLMDRTTTNRESFYVTISRAKHQLRLYTNDKAALVALAQKPKAKENVSDYIFFLFQGATHHAQTPQTPDQLAPASEHRDLAKHIGESVGGHIDQKLANDLSRPPADRERTDCLASTSRPTGAANAADPTDPTDPTADFERQLESLSGAIADFVAERNLSDCTGEFAAAVTAVGRGLEYLEQSAQSRSQLAAAVARLHAAIGREADSSQSAQLLDSEQLLANQSAPEQENLPSSEDGAAVQYRQLWQRYSQSIQASNPVQQDYLAAKRAFEEGCSPKQIALMLIAGSSYVQQIHQQQGKAVARDYVNQTAQAACSQASVQKRISPIQKGEGRELGDYL